MQRFMSLATATFERPKYPKRKKQGEGYVIVLMIIKAEADLYVLVDGDDTYPAESVHALMQSLLEKADMNIGVRLAHGKG